MFSKNLDQIPDSLSKTACFDLLTGIGLTDEDLAQLDGVLLAHGFMIINEIKNAMVIGSTTLSIMVKTNMGDGTFQFTKIERLKTIDVTYLPMGTTTVGSIQQIMRIDISGREEPEVEDTTDN